MDILFATGIGSILIDLTPPTLDILSPINNTIYTTPNIDLIFTVYDNFGVTNCYLHINNNETEIPCKNTTLNLASGNYSLMLRVCDAAGNCNNNTVNFIVDTIPPSVLEYGIHNNQTVFIRAKDNFGVTKIVLYINGTKVKEFSNTTAEYNLTDGFYSIKWVLYDIANNTNSIAYNILVKNYWIKIGPKELFVNETVRIEYYTKYEKSLTVIKPDGTNITFYVINNGTILFNNTDIPGEYTVIFGSDTLHFYVNPIYITKIFFKERPSFIIGTYYKILNNTIEIRSKKEYLDFTFYFRNKKIKLEIFGLEIGKNYRLFLEYEHIDNKEVYKFDQNLSYSMATLTISSIGKYTTVYKCTDTCIKLYPKNSMISIIPEKTFSIIIESWKETCAINVENYTFVRGESFNIPIRIYTKTYCKEKTLQINPSILKVTKLDKYTIIDDGLNFIYILSGQINKTGKYRFTVTFGRYSKEFYINIRPLLKISVYPSFIYKVVLLNSEEKFEIEVKNTGEDIVNIKINSPFKVHPKSFSLKPRESIRVYGIIKGKKTGVYRDKIVIKYDAGEVIIPIVYKVVKPEIKSVNLSLELPREVSPGEEFTYKIIVNASSALYRAKICINITEERCYTIKEKSKFILIQDRAKINKEGLHRISIKLYSGNQEVLNKTYLILVKKSIFPELNVPIHIVAISTAVVILSIIAIARGIT